ncbi:MULTISPECIES: RidA family protein [Clostridium]|uniref:Endoribonuclease L-PSP, putative n=1 Tax=Clostridium novyi (strain NT) TaxID=386415 RepID=A0Q3C0_CLONN|nr:MULTISPECIES: RidA family protein [Clostridium]ABK62578.1 endoribonuclease L-PSP, putative [Clostridium novyi NT]KEH87578.1 endoribonuclease L-PSP [Clostridium novyi A str. NCTC 538]KEH87663.1 endoribonuclease L-PSP [Clostridium novyi A str. BKT29909]KEH92599.1 endoribonuclease L-PSP [Clostridium botulinum C/D str. It1]KEH92887.1 endoribonuclease L-PSP [Clostridium novyi A str. GD211209]
MKKEVISTSNAPGALGPYSQGIKVGEFVFVSGQIPINPKDNSIPKTIKEQTKQSLDNIKAILSEVNLDFSNIVKTTIFLTDLNDFNDVNEVYGTYFEGDYPARCCLEVSKLPKDVSIEIEVMAIEK